MSAIPIGQVRPEAPPYTSCIFPCMNEIRALRRAAGLSQAALADLVGLSQPNISAYESGVRQPSAETLARIEVACRPRPSAVLTAHRDEVLRIADRHKASNVRVFGSVARGEDTAESDIDLLVRFAEGTSLLDLVGLVDDLEQCLGIHVDVVSEKALGKRNNSIRRDAVPV